MRGAALEADSGSTSEEPAIAEADVAAALADHEVVQDFDAEQRSGGGEPPRQGEVLGRGLGVADGWLWLTTRALARIAGLKTSRGYVAATVMLRSRSKASGK